MRERPIWIGDREREAAGGRKGGEVSELIWVGFGAVGFFRWMDGW